MLRINRDNPELPTEPCESPSSQSNKLKSFSSSNLEEFFSGAKKYTLSNNERQSNDKTDLFARKISKIDDNTNKKDKKTDQSKKSIVIKEPKDLFQDKREKSEQMKRIASNKEAKEERDRGDGLGERIILVMQVARRAQNWLGTIADAAETVAR